MTEVTDDLADASDGPCDGSEPSSDGSYVPSRYSSVSSNSMESLVGSNELEASHQHLQCTVDLLRHTHVTLSISNASPVAWCCAITLEACTRET